MDKPTTGSLNDRDDAVRQTYITYGQVPNSDEPESVGGLSASRAQGGAVHMPSVRLDPFKLAEDAVAVLVPLAFLAFTAALWRLDGTDVESSVFSAWQNAVTVLATLFPILFAIIIGRLVYQVARWKLESGLTMGSLEQLLGSRTVGSVFTTQISLGTFNLLGLVLVIIWAFSPLGTQAILRTFGSYLEPRESISITTHYNNNYQTGLAAQRVLARGEQRDGYFRLLTQLFLVNMMASLTAKMNSMDQWGNVKIPFLPIPETDSQEQNDRWQSIDVRNTIPEMYSSLAGFPVYNVSSGNTTIYIESTYIELDCHNISKTGMYNSGMRVQWNISSAINYWSPDRPRNGTWQGDTPRESEFPSDNPPKWLIALNNFVHPLWDNVTAQVARRGPTGAFGSPEHLSPYHVFLDEDGIQAESTELLLDSQLLTAVCTVRQRYVESRVLCEHDATSNSARTCIVTDQRPWQRPHPTELISHLNFPLVWSWLSQELPPGAAEMGGPEGVDQDIVMQYLHDSALTEYHSDLMFHEIDNALFSRRLSQILNTYLLLSQVYEASVGGSTGETVMNTNVTSIAPTIYLTEVYTISQLWAALFAVSVAVMLIGGLMSIVFRHMAASPDILGYASTVVRDSRFVNLPPGSDKMSSMDITKKNMKQRLRYGATVLMRSGEPVYGIGLEEETQRIK